MASPSTFSILCCIILTAVLLAFVAKKLCPGLILLTSNFERYSEMSDKVMDIFERYDPTMLAAGCDEGYLKYVMAATFERVGTNCLFTQHHEILRGTHDRRGYLCTRNS